MRRRSPASLAAVLALSWAGSAPAVNVERYPIPYFGLAYEQLMTDSSRKADDGDGVQVTIGVPLASGHGAVELRFFDAGYDSATGAQDNQSGIFVDYVRDFGPIGTGEGFPGGVKPFLNAGLGFVDEDVADDKHLHFALGLGGGVLLPLGWNGWAVRLDARAVRQANDESVAGERALLDYHVNLGVQIPMSLFFDKPVKLEPIDECPVAVVGMGGRRECADADSDADGVNDPSDECPGTRGGTAVDRRGCPRAASSDVDGDGVANAQDACPGTQPELKVDASGCVVAQNTALRGVTFQPSSARLTPEGRQTLDGVASTLKGQGSLRVEIAGHTDSIGSEAYNMLLSQQRAEAVRAHLVEQGISDERMSAVGYGELEPVASNDTDAGRDANRRVEFRITTE